MSEVYAIFATIGEHIPFKKKEKIGEANSEGSINLLHYRATVLVIICFCLLVTSVDLIAGNDGGMIQCLHAGPIPEQVINTYCYIQGTFTIPGHYKETELIPKFKGDVHSWYPRVGNVISSAGVGPYNAGRKDDGSAITPIEVKAYYQWVPFMLFLQAIMFYVPHIIYKAVEGKKLKNILDGLNLWVMKDDERESKEEVLADYVLTTKGIHREWALQCIGAQFLYLVNVVGQIFFVDCFLGWEFTKYGMAAAAFSDLDDEERVDPMSKVFPRVTKCTFQKYGPSGTIQNHDAQCVLPINIINEKIYVFMWFWFAFLTVLTVVNFIWSVAVIFQSSARAVIVAKKLRINPNREKYRRKIDKYLIVRNLDFGDWKLFYHILRNVDSITFAEFCQKLTEKLKKQDEDKLHGADTLPMKSLLKLDDEKDNLNKDSKPDDDILKPPRDEDDPDRLGFDGNYLKPKIESDI